MHRQYASEICRRAKKRFKQWFYVPTVRSRRGDSAPPASCVGAAHSQYLRRDIRGAVQAERTLQILQRDPSTWRKDTVKAVGTLQCGNGVYDKHIHALDRQGHITRVGAPLVRFPVLPSHAATPRSINKHRGKLCKKDSPALKLEPKFAL